MVDKASFFRYCYWPCTRALLRARCARRKKGLLSTVLCMCQIFTDFRDIVNYSVIHRIIITTSLKSLLLGGSHRRILDSVVYMQVSLMAAASEFFFFCGSFKFPDAVAFSLDKLG